MPDIVEINIPKPASVTYQEEWLKSVQAGAPLDPNALYRQFGVGPLGNVTANDPLQFTRDGRTVLENFQKSPAGEEITVSTPVEVPTPPAAPTVVAEGLPDYYIRWYGADIARLITRKASGGWDVRAADAARVAGIRYGEGLANPTLVNVKRTNEVANLLMDQILAERRATGAVSAGTYAAFEQAQKLSEEAVNAYAGQVPGYRAPTAEQVALGLAATAAARGDLVSYTQGLETVLKVQQGEAGPGFLSEFRVRSVPHTIDVKPLLEQLRLKAPCQPPKILNAQGECVEIVVPPTVSGYLLGPVLRNVAGVVSTTMPLLVGWPGIFVTESVKAVNPITGFVNSISVALGAIQYSSDLWGGKQIATPGNLPQVAEGATTSVPSKPFWQFW